MGADGGILYVRLTNPYQYARVINLIGPFYRLINDDGGASWADEANYHWREANPSIVAPRYLLGYYGTDRGDSISLRELPELCCFEDDALYDLTFEELDLDCRTFPYGLDYPRYGHILYRLRYEHFDYVSHDETISRLGTIAKMPIKEWAREVRSLLDLRNIAIVETWT